MPQNFEPMTFFLNLILRLPAETDAYNSDAPGTVTEMVL